MQTDRQTATRFVDRWCEALCFKEGKAIELNLIPFGLRENDGELVDVADVPRGKKSGCICPSCKTPLIARHGDVKEWHFAHASRAVYSRTEKECTYSFYVSVRMMSRQIIGGEIVITLPEYKDSVSVYLPQFGRTINEVFTISEQHKIILSNVQIEHNYLGIPVDVLGRVGEFSIIIYFTHPGRDVPLEFFNPHNAKCGIISVSLVELPVLFRSARISKGSYHAILHDFLRHNISSKEWVFHPRYRRCEEGAKNKLEEQKVQLIQSHRLSKTAKSDSFTSTSENTIIDNPVVVTPKRLAVYECVICHTTWQEWVPSASICPKCKTHLYSRLKRYVGSET